jgi:hypothetical protein
VLAGTAMLVAAMWQIDRGLDDAVMRRAG